MRKKYATIILITIVLANILALLPLRQSGILAAYTYTVTFDSQGGTPVEPITATPGETITLPDPPTRTGYRFLSWTCMHNGKDETLTESTIIDSDMTYFAKWEMRSYTVRFVDWDDQLLSEELLPYGSYVGQPFNKPTRSGYLFYSWDQPIQSPAAADITYKAVYIPMPVKKITSSQFRMVADDYGPVILVPAGTTAARLLAGVDTPRELTSINNVNGRVQDDQLVRQYDMLQYFVQIDYYNNERVFQASDEYYITLIGDVNTDNQLTEDDRLGLLGHLLERNRLRNLGLPAADVDGDGQITALDLLLIKRLLLS